MMLWDVIQTYSSSSFPIRVYDLLQKQDTKMFNNDSASDDHPSSHKLYQRKTTSFNLCKKLCIYPKINTRGVLKPYL
jgi:hypothetical protein